ncbi:MAG: radical SAM protein [Gracilibacteraceae bacterium]|nr:radical SAM protein [Gracilibacteraceae bacterium]
MNIYRGCLHNCVYCDSRSDTYNMHHDFEEIEVKRNAPRILEAQLRKRRSLCMIATGAMGDPYLPLEKDLQYTRQCLEVIEKHGFGVTVLTKSASVLRDLDVLKRINDKAKAVVQMTLTTFDEKLCRILEPDASSTAERFRALEICRDNGVPTVVWLCPLLPFINDTEENLRGILDYCVRAKVAAIMCFGFGTTMRGGSRDYFFRKLDEHFPGLQKKYKRAFGDAYVCPSPNEKELDRIFRETCDRHGIICDRDEVFAYLNDLPDKSGQLTLFDM